MKPLKEKDKVGRTKKNKPGMCCKICPISILMYFGLLGQFAKCQGTNKPHLGRLPFGTMSSVFKT